MKKSILVGVALGVAAISIAAAMRKRPPAETEVETRRDRKLYDRAMCIGGGELIRLPHLLRAA